ncbi:alpha/beta hydrolase, partial [Burkholderia sp. SIMBA_052]
IDGADHGLSDEGSQRAYTALVVTWLGEMIGGLRAGSRGEAANPPIR